MFSFLKFYVHFGEAVRAAFAEDQVKALMRITLVLLSAAAIFYHYVEGWSWLDSFYFSTVTMATVGYGDLTPHTASGKVFTIAFIVIGIGIFVAAVGALAEAIVRHMRERIGR